MKNISLDRADIDILRHLQKDGRASVSDLASQMNLSISACHRRLTKLQNDGVIDRYLTLIKPQKIGYQMSFYVDITLREQSVEAFENFENSVRQFDEILQCHLLAGQADYLLLIAAKDAEDFSRIHEKKLANLPGVAHMHSNLVIREVKPFTGYPL